MLVFVLFKILTHLFFLLLQMNTSSTYQLSATLTTNIGVSPEINVSPILTPNLGSDISYYNCKLENDNSHETKDQNQHFLKKNKSNLSLKAHHRYMVAVSSCFPLSSHLKIHHHSTF